MLPARPTPVIPARPVAQSDSYEERVRFVGQASHESVENSSARIRGLPYIDPSSNIELVECMVSGTAFPFGLPRDTIYTAHIWPDSIIAASVAPAVQAQPESRYALAPVPSPGQQTVRAISKQMQPQQTEPRISAPCRAGIEGLWKAPKKRFHETLEVNPYL